jgi:hypothetical protein
LDKKNLKKYFRKLFPNLPLLTVFFTGPERVALVLLLFCGLWLFCAFLSSEKLKIFSKKFNYRKNLKMFVPKLPLFASFLAGAESVPLVLVLFSVVIFFSTFLSAEN